jgi:hypothetical protein
MIVWFWVNEIEVEASAALAPSSNCQYAPDSEGAADGGNTNIAGNLRAP